MGVVDLTQIEDVALDRSAGGTPTLNDTPVAVKLPVLLTLVAAEVHGPEPYQKPGTNWQGGGSALHQEPRRTTDQITGFQGNLPAPCANFPKNPPQLRKSG